MAKLIRKLLNVDDKRSKPLQECDIQKFSIDELKNDSNKIDEYLKWMDVEGFTVFTLSNEIQELVNLYWDLTRKFFKESMDYKKQFKGKSKYNDEIFDNKRQVNKGFLTIKEKEFLKLSLSDPTQTTPSDINGFDECFKNLCEELESMALYLYKLIANSNDNNTTYHEKVTSDAVMQSVRKGSSLSMIDYQPILKKDAKIVNGRDEPTSDTHFPSSTHCDTGLLTIIICSTVPALQVKDRITDDWFMPEKFCNPKQDCFVILGKKIHQLAEFDRKTSKFQPTVHRVILPYETQRNSLLYFQDVLI